MNTIKIHDKTFRISIPESQLMEHIDAVAARINRDYEGKTPLVLGVLNGAFMFASDLMKRLTIPCEISFVKLASYQGTTSTGKVREVLGINEDLTGRNIIIVEDIVDTGTTIASMIEQLGTRCPASIEICAMLFKPEKLQVPLTPKYVAMEIPNEFIVGHGLDYDQKGRNLRDIYVITD